MSKFRAGDRVTFNSTDTDYSDTSFPQGKQGTVVGGNKDDWLVKFDDARKEGHGDDEACWWCADAELTLTSVAAATTDTELAALAAVIGAMAPLSPDQRERIGDYIRNRFDI